MVPWWNRRKVGVRKFYEKQNDLVEAWKEDEKVLTTSVDQIAQAAKEQRVKVSLINYRLVTSVVKKALLLLDLARILRVVLFITG